MIRVCLFGLLVILCSSFTFGQVRIGIHGGLNLSDYTYPNEYAKTHPSNIWLMRPHALGGVVIDYAFDEHLLIAGQVNFIQKGILAVNELFERGGPGWTIFTNSYIEVPVCVRWRVRDEPFRWFVECGPSMAYLARATAHSVYVVGIPPTEYDIIGIRGIFNDVDVGITVGVGGEHNLSKSIVLTYSVHYSHGLTEVFADNWEGSRSQGVQFDFGVLVSL